MLSGRVDPLAAISSSRNTLLFILGSSHSATPGYGGLSPGTAEWASTVGKCSVRWVLYSKLRKKVWFFFFFAIVFYLRNSYGCPNWCLKGKWEVFATFRQGRYLVQLCQFMCLLIVVGCISTSLSGVMLLRRKGVTLPDKQEALKRALELHV